MMAVPFPRYLLDGNKTLRGASGAKTKNRITRANEYFGTGLTLLSELLRREIKLVMRRMFVKMMKMSYWTISVHALVSWEGSFHHYRRTEKR